MITDVFNNRMKINIFLTKLYLTCLHDERDFNPPKGSVILKGEYEMGVWAEPSGLDPSRNFIFN